MKKSLLFLPLLGLASNVAAQELRGVVTDADNNPLVGASVYWAETTIGASTSATGAYTVHRVKNYDRLVASYLGYVNDTIRIADGVAEQNFRLRSEGVDIEGAWSRARWAATTSSATAFSKAKPFRSQASAKWPAAIWPSRSKTRLGNGRLQRRHLGRTADQDARTRPAPIRRFSTRTAPSCAGCRPPTD